MALVSNPRQASVTFDLGGVTAPRPKGLFYVRFRLANNALQNGIGQYWQNNIGFLVKSVDQPSAQPKTEELNQYNKRRQVYTGMSVEPFSVTLYDTVDNMAMRMVNDYMTYYFGDFRQQPINFAYDVVDFGSGVFGSSTGFGFAPDTTNSDANSQFFFSGIDIYQVFRQTYVTTTLINPRITSYTPEELEYETMNHNTVRLQLAYEAINYANSGVPQPIASNSFLSALFQDTRINGNAGEPDGATASGVIGGALAALGVPSSLTSAVTDVLGSVSPALGSTLNSLVSSSISPVISGLGGVLGGLGSFNFGSALPTGAIGSTALSAGLQGTSLTSLLSSSPSPQTSAAGSSFSSQIATNSQAVSSLNATNTGGLQLTDDAYAATNDSSDSTSQIGYIPDDVSGLF